MINWLLWWQEHSPLFATCVPGVVPNDRNGFFETEDINLLLAQVDIECAVVVVVVLSSLGDAGR